MSGARYALAFESTHAAMAANKALEALDPVMIPTPRALSAGCGMTLRFDAAGDDRAIDVVSGIAALHGLASLYADDEGDYRLVKKL